MKKRKFTARVLAALLCMVMCMSVLTTTAFAANVAMDFSANPVIGGKTTNYMTEDTAGNLTYSSALGMENTWDAYKFARALYLANIDNTEVHWKAKKLTASFTLNVQLDASRVEAATNIADAAAIKQALVASNPGSEDFVNLFTVTGAAYNDATGLWTAGLALNEVSLETLDPIIMGENAPNTIMYVMPAGSLKVTSFEAGKSFDADCHITGELTVGPFENPSVQQMLPFTFDEQATATVHMVDKVILNFNKYLVMKQTTNVPDVSFDFEIAPGDAVAGTETTPQINAGPAGAVLTESTISFTDTDASYDTVQTGDTVTLSTGEKYAKKAVTVDLSKVVFPEPGIYRYVITESGTNQGVTNDPNPVRYLDVSVTVDEDGKFVIADGGYILHSADAVMDETGKFDKKDDGFINKYDSYAVSVTKQITGNQGVRDKYFKFTVSIANAVPGTKLAVNYSNGAVSGEVTVDGTTYTNPTTLTVGEDGKVSQDFYLNDDDTITIGGLSADATYAVSEDNADYQASYTVDATEGTVPTEGNSIAAAGMGGKDHAVEFTNDRTGVVPTGILLEITPYIMIFAVAVIGAVWMISRRRRTTLRR